MYDAELGNAVSIVVLLLLVRIGDPLLDVVSCGMAFGPPDFDGIGTFGERCSVKVLPQVSIRYDAKGSVAPSGSGLAEEEICLVDEGSRIGRDVSGIRSIQAHDASSNFATRGAAVQTGDGSKNPHSSSLLVFVPKLFFKSVQGGVGDNTVGVPNAKPC